MFKYPLWLQLQLKRGFAGDGVNCTDLGIVATVSPTASITPSISNSRSPTVSETSSSASVSVIASPTHSITPSISESPKSPPSISDGKAVICGFTFKSKWQSCCYRCDAAMFAFFARLICRFMVRKHMLTPDQNLEQVCCF